MIGVVDRSLKAALLWVLALKVQFHAQRAEGSIKGKGVDDLGASIDGAAQAAQLALDKMKEK
jgi:hypothetical protein